MPIHSLLNFKKSNLFASSWQQGEWSFRDFYSLESWVYRGPRITWGGLLLVSLLWFGPNFFVPFSVFIKTKQKYTSSA